MADRNRPVTAPRPLPVALGGLAGLLFVLASACGGGGGGTSVPACRTDAETELPPPSPEASLTLTVGSYEGTSSPQCISDLGFDPVVVIIKGDTGEPAVWRSISMEGDSTADFAIGNANIEDAITSLDADAFSLGNDPTTNAEGVTYQYVAFADSPEIKASSYAGDATDGRSIADVGFQPALVLVKWDGPRSAVWRSIAHPEGISSFFDVNESQAGFIGAFEADGFQVSSDPWLNQFDRPDQPTAYHYVAFREVPGRLATGSYVGDGSANQDITAVGFQPDYVWIKRDSNQSKGVHRTSSLSGDTTLRFEGVPNASGEIKALQPDGFLVGAEPSVNFDGDTYHYVAWKAGSGP